MLEVVILLKTYLIKYVFQIKQKTWIYMIAGKNESKILTKDISCKCKCRFDGKKLRFEYIWSHEKINQKF